jgi:hypothetical protein
MAKHTKYSSADREGFNDASSSKSRNDDAFRTRKFRVNALAKQQVRATPLDANQTSSATSCSTPDAIEQR